MNQQLIRGRNLLAAIIIGQLIISAIGIYLYSSGKIATILATELAALPEFQEFSAALLETQMQRTAVAGEIQHWIALGMLLFWSILLYLGISWVRWLSGVGWLLSGLFGIVVGGLLLSTGQLTALLLPSLAIWAIYAISGGMLLFSPSIGAYYRMMHSG